MIRNCILVHLNCCNKMPWNGWLINNRNLYFTALEAGKSKIIFPADLESGENLLPGSFSSLFTMSSYDRSEQGGHWDHFF